MCIAILISAASFAQTPVKKQPVVDTAFTDYDALFSELDAFIDSLMTPRSFGIFNMGAGTGYLNYQSDDGKSTAKRKYFYTPSFSYYSKTGFGISAGATIVDNGNTFNPYQFSITGSYDYIKNRKFVTGVSITQYFTKDSLPFYTSPLQFNASAFFTYRNFWLKPSISANYGWGRRTEYYEREERLKIIRMKPRGYTQVNTEESINDLDVTLSVRHDFYWLNLLSSKDFARITPQISFTGGTQKFGFNQSSDSYATVRGLNSNVLYKSQNVYLDDKMIFQPLSVTAYLKTEYSFGKVYVQPQFLVDYYLPATDQNISTSFLLSAGVIF
jgi:hypothetical protein